MKAILHLPRDIALAASILLATRAAGASPDKKTTDGLYGRFDGDLDLSAAIGGSLVRGGSGVSALMRLLFLETAGLYVGYDDALGHATSAPARSLAIGVGIRPVFLPRWSYDADRGPAIVDLTLDAFTLDLGVLWSADERGRLADKPGLELAVGTEVPLVGRAAGPWIGARGALRWSASELSGSSDAALGPALYLTFAWHFIADAHVVDTGDEV